MTIEEILIVLFWGTFVVVGQGLILLFLVFLLRRRQVWPFIMFGLRGGTMILKAYPNNVVEVLRSTKPVREVEWTVTDKATGKKKKIYQPIKKVWHVLKNTPYPLHLCAYNAPTNVSMVDREAGLLSVEEINALMVKQYTQGASDATSFRSIAGFPIDKATLFMLFIVGIMMVIVIAMNWQIMGAVAPPQ